MAAARGKKAVTISAVGGQRDGSFAARIALTPFLAAPIKARRAFAAAIEAAPADIREALNGVLNGRKPARAVMAAIAENSPFLTELIRSDPARLLRMLTSDPRARLETARAEAQAAADATADEATIMRALRRLRAETALLVAIGDIGGVLDLAEVTEALTLAADVAIASAVDFLLREAVAAKRLRNYGEPRRPAAGAGSGYVVLAMGKHGGGELNYSSDVDLIVLYDPSVAPLAKDAEPAPVFVRLTKSLVRLIQERTVDGYVARVDLRLRPDPASTPIALSIDSALDYYEREGATWERAAYIKARPIAGDLALGHAFLRQLSPFVWRRSLDYAAVADVHAMKQEINAFRGHAAIAVNGHNVKLGRGGIREIEFFAQTQQLIAGGRDPDLRTPRTLDALSRLAAEGWIGERARDELSEAYIYLRRVEHRLQMVADAQTHTLPDDAAGLLRFAHFMGDPDVATFSDALTQRLNRVQHHYSRLFEDSPPRAAVDGRLEFPSDRDDRETLATLRKLGFQESKEASAVVRGWLAGAYRSLRAPATQGHLAAIMPAFLDALARGGAADVALKAADRFFQELPAGLRLMSALARNPDLVRLLATILGSAPRLGETLAHRPELVDALLDPAFFGALPDEAVLEERLTRLLADAEGDEDLLDRARRFRQEYHLLIGVRILAGTLPAAQAGEAFARLADVVIRALESAVRARFTAMYGTIRGAEVAVLAMGKLGGREMTSGSDLDLIVLYDFDERHPQSDGERSLHGTQYFARLTQRIVSALTTPTNAGQLYAVDLRLRPSGRAGPIATRLSAFAAYQRDEAWTWEHMALTRARVVCASPAFRSRVESAIARILRTERNRARLAADIVDMRAAIAADKGDDAPWDLKYARGGLVDVEFIAQFLVLAHAARHPEILDTSTARVIAVAGRLGLLDPEDAQRLGNACQLLHDLTQVIRLAVSEPFEPAQASPALRRILARAGAMPDFSTLEAHLVETQSAVREVFERLLGE
ncbi:bifunctional [glutamine synthetase] adenylyltransferase/[glutamine synthetase]-adenylyl-L-tyrosine phosphorylase [Ancylobacter terrae]|uniref:bifunctional [glutamine synthetase] adenylyltransferase/[glutamine synthetase]-adenylyl-L-tyrosine phosphorylase n=1 Tax=Ancylobacter sp. sgz301288 TaxID=3342077 RepID=UPI00385FF19F